MPEKLTYNYRLIVSGSHFEEYRYARTQRRGYPRRVRNIVKKNDIPKPKVVSDFSFRRAKQQIKRLVNTNVSMDKFVTLTFRDNFTDLSAANILFNRFIKRLRYRYGDFKFLVVPEFQQRGAVHYHMVCSLPYVRNSRLRALWRHGFVNIKLVHRRGNLGSYLSKYLTKDTASLLFGKKKYFTSQNIECYTEILNDGFNLPTSAVFDFGAFFFTKYTGRVEYACYHLPPCPDKGGSTEGP